MLGWLLFYSLSLLLLFAKKKHLSYIYPILFWIFVGFRDNIGTDYPFQLEVLERSFMPFSDIALNFYSYNALDLEALHKFIAMFMCVFDFELKIYYVIIAGIEALITHYVLKKSNNPKLFLIFFLCFFTVNYPMNAARQGVSFMFVLLAYMFECKEKKTVFSKAKTLLSYMFAILGHYGTAVISVLSYIKINKIKTYVLFITVLVVIFRFTDIDMIDSRYGSAASHYEFGGFGFRIFLFAFVVFMTNFKLFGKGIKDQDNIFLLVLMGSVFVSHAVMRVFFMYAYLLSFKCLIMADYKEISGNRRKILLIFPIMAFSFELLEIIRTTNLPGAGIWFPYTNWLL